jgi:peptidoglycan-N-acetylglucosamine deacetylase
MCEAPGRPIVPSRGLPVYYALVPLTLPLTAAGVAIGAWAYGTYEPNSPLFGRAIARGSRRERAAYLTFDDGPNPGATERILETLAVQRVPAAFFMVGEHVRRFPDIARRVAAAGHEVGNHTFRHRKLHFQGPRRIDEELGRTHELITAVTARAPRAFRAPHGYRNPFVGRATRRLGYTVFGWTFGVWDSDPGVAPDTIRARVRRKLSPGAIILLHDGDGYDPEGDRQRTAQALPGIIDDARAAGYTFRPLAELLV